MVASVTKRRKIRKKAKGKSQNRIRRLKCKATRRSWKKSATLESNFTRLGIKIDPNSDIKKVQNARTKQIRKILNLKQAKSDLKWKLKQQSKIINKNEKKLKQLNQIKSNTNTNDNSTLQTTKSNQNKQKQKIANFQLPLEPPKIDKNSKNGNNSTNNNSNNGSNDSIELDLEKTASKTNKLKESHSMLANEMNKVENKLESLNNRKFDSKLRKDEIMTFENVAKQTSNGKFGGNLPKSMNNTYLKHTLELAMNSMPHQVRNNLKQHRKEYFQRLICKYGTNYRAMARDKQLNFFQLTKNRIKKDIEYNKHVFMFPEFNPNGQRKKL